MMKCTIVLAIEPWRKIQSIDCLLATEFDEAICPHKSSLLVALNANLSSILSHLDEK